jgi:hypothetical protein
MLRLLMSLGRHESDETIVGCLRCISMNNQVPFAHIGIVVIPSQPMAHLTSPIVTCHPSDRELRSKKLSKFCMCSFG